MPRYDPSVRPITKRRLFDVRADSQDVVSIGADQNDWFRYALGYKHAADVLVSQIIGGRRISQDVGVPVLFLYRHFVELSLKGMLLDAGELLDDDKLPSPTHPLTPHWQNLRGRIKAIGESDSGDWMDRAESLIKELDSLDGSSFTFRYPVNRSGSPSLTRRQDIDIANLRDVMKEFETVLYGIAAWLGNYVDLKHEMDSDAGAYGY